MCLIGDVGQVFDEMLDWVKNDFVLWIYSSHVLEMNLTKLLIVSVDQVFDEVYE